MIATVGSEPPERWILVFDAEVAERSDVIAESAPKIKKNTLVFLAFRENVRSPSTMFRELTLVVNMAYAAILVTDMFPTDRFAP